jgi:hypothetical protein
MVRSVSEKIERNPPAGLYHSEVRIDSQKSPAVSTFANGPTTTVKIEPLRLVVPAV